MTRLSLAWLALFSAASLSSAAEPEVDPEPVDFVKVFNGRDLKGWKVFPKGTGRWEVKDGVLVGSGALSHLFSERGDYQNIHLRVVAKINENGNSGVYFRTKFGKNPTPVGWEAQIALSGDRIKSGSLYPDSREADLRGVKDLLVLDSKHRAGEWFTLEVICKGDHIVIKIDGKETVNWKDPKNRFKKGHLALQQHNVNSVVQFRKIEVKRLPDDR
jgi:hypothetical protein